MAFSVTSRPVVTDRAGVQQRKSSPTLLAVQIDRDLADSVSRICAALNISISDLIRAGMAGLLAQIIDDLPAEIRAEGDEAIHRFLECGRPRGARRIRREQRIRQLAGLEQEAA